jgi:hypothetical protein
MLVALTIGRTFHDIGLNVVEDTVSKCSRMHVTDAILFRLATKHGLLARCVHASYLNLPNIGVEAPGMGNVL